MERHLRFVDGVIESLEESGWGKVSRDQAVKEVSGWEPSVSNQLVLRCRRLDKKEADYVFRYPRQSREEVPIQVGPSSIGVDPKKFGKWSTHFKIVEQDPRPGNGDGSEGTIYPVLFEVVEVLSTIYRPPPDLSKPMEEVKCSASPPYSAS